MTVHHHNKKPSTPGLTSDKTYIKKPNKNRDIKTILLSFSIN